MKKKSLIIGILIVILSIAIGVFFYFKQKNKLEAGSLSYNYNYTYSGTISDYKRMDFSGNADFGIFAADKGLKERLVINNFNISLKKGKRTAQLAIKGLDIIQNEYKKYVKIGDISFSKNGVKNDILDSNIKTNIYYLIDDSIIKEKLGRIYQKELVKLAIRSFLTSNPPYYLKKNHFIKKFKQTILSEKLAHTLFPKKGGKYIINNKLCEIIPNYYDQQNCKQLINILNEKTEVKWKKNTLILKPKSNSFPIIKISYNNKVFDFVEFIYEKDKAYVKIDKEGIQKININIQIHDNKAIVQYERGKQDLFVDININDELSGISFIGKYENKKGEFNFINKNENVSVKIKIDHNEVTVLYKQNKYKGIFKIDFDKKNINGGIYKESKQIFKIINDDNNFNLVLHDDVDLNIIVNKKTYEGEFIFDDKKDTAFNIKSTKENNNLHIVGGGKFTDTVYSWREGKYITINHKLNIDLVINKEKTNGYISLDKNKLNINAYYKNGYDIDLSGITEDGKKRNLKIKGKDGKGTISLDLGYEKPLFVAKYDISKDLKKVYLDIEATLVKIKVERNLDKNFNDKIHINIKKNDNDIFIFNAKGKITKGKTSYKIPNKFEKIPEKYSMLVFYNLPNFTLNDYELEKEYKEFFKEFIGKDIGKNSFFAGAIGGSILVSALLPKIKNAQKRAKDVARKATLQQLSTALMLYFSDNGQYPKGDFNILKSELVPTYISNIPKDPEGKKYFYHVLKNKGTNNASFILGAQMSNPKDCNINAYSEQDLIKIIQDNKYESSYINKLIKKEGNYKKGCYYVIIY